MVKSWFCPPAAISSSSMVSVREKSRRMREKTARGPRHRRTQEPASCFALWGQRRTEVRSLLQHQHCEWTLCFWSSHLFRMTAPTLLWAGVIEKKDFCLLRRRSPSTSCCFWVPEFPKWKVLARALSSGAGRRSRASPNSWRSHSSTHRDSTGSHKQEKTRKFNLHVWSDVMFHRGGK